MGKVLVIGSLNTDLVMKTEKFAKPGETVLGGKFEVFEGGKGANQAVAAARAGAKTTFVAKIGNDSFGKSAIELYKKEGINCDNIIVSDKTNTGTAIIMVENNTGENSIVVDSGANAELSAKEIESIEDIISQNDAILLQLETPIETVKRALEIAKKHGVITILDPAPAKHLSDDLLELVDYITPNETECEILTTILPQGIDNLEMAADALISKVKQACIITLGDRGSYYKTIYECSSLVPTRKVDTRDTTAAGDTFNGYLAKYLSDNAKLEEAILFANRAAAKSTSKMGAQPSIPRSSEIE